ncbi:MAG: hypothetical protein H7Z42_17720 [Roseiflexaceae bacterium]|nr:hypothetical protein [Roseiflexaceae bacterium]
MSHYTLDELLERWKHEDLTEAQTIGQLLQMLRKIDARVRELERAKAPTSEPEPKNQRSAQ